MDIYCKHSLETTLAIRTNNAEQNITNTEEIFLPTFCRTPIFTRQTEIINGDATERPTRKTVGTAKVLKLGEVTTFSDLPNIPVMNSNLALADFIGSPHQYKARVKKENHKYLKASTESHAEETDEVIFQLSENYSFTKIDTDKNKYLVAINYGEIHQLTCAFTSLLPQVWAIEGCEGNLSECEIIIRENKEQNSHLEEIFRILNAKVEVSYIRHDTNYQFSDISIASINGPILLSRRYLNWLRNLFPTTVDAETPQRIFIKETLNTDTNSRNKLQVEQLVTKLGYDVICVDEHNLTNLVNIIRSAKSIIFYTSDIFALVVTALPRTHVLEIQETKLELTGFGTVTTEDVYLGLGLNYRIIQTHSDDADLHATILYELKQEWLTGSIPFEMNPIN
jgi:hypothetical protein